MFSPHFLSTCQLVHLNFRYLLVTLFFPLFFIATAAAQWPTTPDEDLQIASGANGTSLAATESGGVWVQITGPTTEYYNQTFLQRITRWGYPALNNAVEVAGPEDVHTGGDMVADGKKGIYLSYYTATILEFPYFFNASTRLQYYDSTGTPQWAGTGITITQRDSTSYSSHCDAVTDGNGGVLLVWHDYRNGIGADDWDVYAQRYTSDGMAQWNSGGVLVTTRHQRPTHISADSQGGVIIHEGHWVYRLDADGTAQWGVNGVRIPDSISVRAITVDHHANTYTLATYGPRAEAPTYSLMVNRLTPQGQWAWGNHGREVSSESTESFMQSLATGGVFVSWKEKNRWYLQRLSSAGTFQFARPGILVTVDTTAMVESLLPSNDGKLLCFFRLTDRNNELYAQQFDSLGTKVWGDSAVHISTRTQGVLDAVSDQQGGAIIATGNTRLKQVSANGNLGEIVSAIHSEPPPDIPTSLTLYQNYPNPFNSTTQITYRLAWSSRVRISVYNLLGQEVRKVQDRVQPAGRYQCHWDGTAQDGSAVSSGLYVIRLQSGAQQVQQKVLLLR